MKVLLIVCCVVMFGCVSHGHCCDDDLGQEDWLTGDPYGEEAEEYLDIIDEGEDWKDDVLTQCESFGDPHQRGIDRRQPMPGNGH